MNTIANVLAAADQGIVEGLSETANQLGETFVIEWGYIIWQAVSFLILAYVLYRFAFKPVLSTMDERQEKIDAGLKYAEEMKVKLAEAQEEKKKILQEASMEAKQIVTEARVDAESRIERSTQEAIKSAEEVTRKARAQIELDRKQMIAEARSEISRLVVATAAKVLSKELSQDEKSRFAETASANIVASDN